MRVQWTNKLFGGGELQIPGIQGALNIPITRRLLSGLPRNVRDHRMKAAFAELLSGSRPLTEWWARVAGLGTETDFLLEFSNGPWDVPWEMLLHPPHFKGDLGFSQPKSPERICIARTVEPVGRQPPVVLEHKLATLVLTGAPALPGERPLDISGEIKLIQSVYDSLESGIKERIAPPATAEARTGSLVQVLREETPHVIWYSGHGRSKAGKVELFFADNEWVSVNELTRLILESAVSPPLYAVFWACETARGGDAPRVPPAPPLFLELRRCGVHAVLAMQANIRDSSAKIMAAELFRGLSAGLPLERATSVARASLLRAPHESSHEFDWAAPVVWTAGSVPARLTWAEGPSNLIQLQIIGRAALDIRGDAPPQLISPSTPDEMKDAESWGSTHRTLVVGDPADPEQHLKWMRRLAAIQALYPIAVIAVELENGDPALALSLWAESLLDRLTPTSIRTEIRDILASMIRSPKQGWSILCGVSEIHLAISNPPTTSSEKWFWDGLNRFNGNLTILSALEIEPATAPGYEIDKISPESSTAINHQALSQAPRLANAMAVLTGPVPAYILQARYPSGHIEKFLEWPLRNTITVTTGSGPILISTVRQELLHQLAKSKPTLIDAHRDAALMLDEQTLELTAPIREHRLYHLLACDEHAKAATEAQHLLREYRSTARPAAAKAVFEKTMGQLHLFESQGHIDAAIAYLRLGEIENARLLLEQAAGATRGIAEAERLSLLAEADKAEGFIDKCTQQYEKAIHLCDEVPEDSVDYSRARRELWSHKHDLNRIKHFIEYDYKAAESGYRSLIQTAESEGASALDRAKARLNYAQCLMSMSNKHKAASLEKAEDMLRQAESTALQFPNDPLRAEVLYHRARLLHQMGAQAKAEKALRDSILAADDAGYGMLSMIGQAKALRWKTSSVSNQDTNWLETWERLAAGLRRFPAHGWAIRSLVDGNLHAARSALTSNNTSAASDLLRESASLMNKHPGFERGSDQERRLKIAAGIDLLAIRLGQHSEVMSKVVLEKHWAATWLTERSLKTPEQVWNYKG